MNTTAVLVQVTLSGPQQIVFSLQPGDIQLAPITPGNYTVTGQTPTAPNITFSPSAWALAPGCDYLLQIVYLSRTTVALRAR
jgi:hypothetical protein